MSFNTIIHNLLDILLSSGTSIITFQSFTINVSILFGTTHHGITSDIFTSHTTYFTPFAICQLVIFLINKFAFFLIIHLISQVDKSEKFSSCHVELAFQSDCRVHKTLTQRVDLFSHFHFFENSSK
ncbi:MAG: hypothetical protein LBQ59_04355 [Candidatus Peribacteria bacterium]|nr:hypothetical protein [Candidatus Peribacteria bacterium]